MTNQFLPPDAANDRRSNALSCYLLSEQEKEREYLAREMHDSLGQYLLRIRHLAMLGTGDAGASPTATGYCEQISALAAEALQEMRRLIQGLRPEELDCLGFSEAVRAMVSGAAKSSATRFQVDIDEVDELLTPAAEINLFRVAQEGVNNILKHARASACRIAIKRQPRALYIGISDDGIGFNAEGADGSPSAGPGFGLSSIRERIQMLGGELKVSSVPAAGTTLRAVIPIPIQPKAQAGG